MLKEAMMYASTGAVVYAWLCATVAPLVHTLRSCVRERLSVRAAAGFALACAGAVLWTAVPAALVLLGMILMPAAGLALLRAHPFEPGVAAGIGLWLCGLAHARRLPRFGDTFEAATAIGIVAAVRDDARTLARVEALYRAVATDGSRSVKTAPPSGLLDAVTSPPWRTTMARTIDRPRPLPDGTCVPAREASTL